MFNSSSKVITLGFGVMLFILILVTSVSLTSSSSLNKKINDLVHNRNVKTSLISNMRNIARERSLSLYRMVILKDPFDIDEEIINMSNLAGQFLSYRTQLVALEMPSDEKQLVEETLEQVYVSTKTQNKLLKIIRNESFDKAKQFLMETAIPEQNHLLSKYDQLLKLHHKISTAEANDADKKHNQTLVFSLIFSLSIITVGILISIFVIKKTTLAEKQLRKVNETLETSVLERTNSLFQANQELQATIETLQDTQEQLVQAEKMASLGNLVAGISHEINTPIGVGLTAITHLQEQEEKFTKHYHADTMTRNHLEEYIEQSHKVCEIVVTNIKRAADLIINFKQIAVDHSTEAFSTIYLHQYVDDILLSLSPKLKQTKIQILNQCDPDFSLYTNPGAIFQMVSNLVLNSLIHAYDDNDNGTISIHCKPDANAIQFIYSDDGKGIPEQHLNNIFDPFFTTRRGSGGSGLGLHIIYNLVHNTLKGSIKVDSKENNGCRFLITLPLLNEQN